MEFGVYLWRMSLWQNQSLSALKLLHHLWEVEINLLAT